jgi:hypothetical protein
MAAVCLGKGLHKRLKMVEAQESLQWTSWCALYSNTFFGNSESKFFFFMLYINFRWLIHSLQNFLCEKLHCTFYRLVATAVAREENLEWLWCSPSFLLSVLGVRWQGHDGNHLCLVPRLWIWKLYFFTFLYIHGLMLHSAQG